MEQTEIAAIEEPVVEHSESARPVHWGYEGDEGPAGWATLSPKYALCGEGKHQSPIDIETAEVSGTKDWQLNLEATSLKIAHNQHMHDIIDNGHTIQVTVDEGSTFIFDYVVYHLKQFHFHTPSEHTINGQHLPMEMHMVHQSDDEQLAVVSILFEEGNDINSNFKKIITHMPTYPGESKHMTDVSLDLDIHMPEDNYAYHYTGSLTTPPCSESVEWVILRNPVSLAPDQIAAFSSVIGPNNRPTQPLNDRAVAAADLAGQTN